MRSAVGDGQLRHHSDSNPADPAHNRMIANAQISSERRVLLRFSREVSHREAG
jgi:hypothetical protein